MRTILISFFIGVVVYVQTVYASDCVVDVNNPPHCVAENFDYYYTDKNHVLWKYLHSTANKLIRCDNPAEYANFIQLFVYVKGNAEFDEFASKLIETTLVESPLLLAESMLLSSSDVRNKITTMLNTPIYISENEVLMFYSKYKSINKYKEIFE